MNEENNLNNVTTEVPSTTPVEPTQPVVTPEPVAQPTTVAPAPVAPVEPTVAPVVNPAPVAEPTPGGKKSNPIVVVLLIIVLLAVCGYGVYQYTDILKPKNKANNQTTTTTESITTTTSVVTELAYKTIDDYVAAVKANAKNDGSLIIDSSNSYSYINFDMNTKCTADGDKVSFEIGANKVEYTCKNVETDGICEVSWSGTVKVNDKLSMNQTSCIECHNEKLFAGSKGYFNVIEVGCAVNLFDNSIEFFTTDGKSVGKSSYSNVYSLKSDYSDEIAIYPVVKDNVVYFLAGNDADKDSDHTTCTLKYIDLNSSNPTIKSTESTAVCYGENV